MPKSNPTNPHATNDADVEHVAPMPVQRATVEAVGSYDGERGATHTARIRVYGDPSPYEATVLSPSRGDVNIPTEGDDVAVVFGANEQPFIIGFWYAANKVDDGRVNLPEYEPGERVIGTPLNNSYFRIDKDGTITIRSDGAAAINIDRNSFAAYTNTAQSIAGDDQFYKVQFDVEEDDPENLFNPSSYDATLKHDGLYEVGGTIAFPTPGQNNRYSIAIFVNGSQEKRTSFQSTVNNEISLSVELHAKLDEGDVLDIRVRHDRGSPSSINGSKITSSFSAERQGI